MLGNLKVTLECTQAHERHVHYRVPFAVFLRLFKGFYQFLSVFEGFRGVWTDVVSHFKKSAEICGNLEHSSTFRVTHHRAGMLGNLKMTLECTQAHERHVHYRVRFAVFLRFFKDF